MTLAIQTNSNSLYSCLSDPYLWTDKYWKDAVDIHIKISKTETISVSARRNLAIGSVKKIALNKLGKAALDKQYKLLLRINGDKNDLVDHQDTIIGNYLAPGFTHTFHLKLNSKNTSNK